ncbi:MAG: PQQ-binding-like beta-propeller repeat protein [Bryobacterales bacterium]|nr:PQQ-binding-like beta-propeller repeat protein [Bryobacterales bacterium]
MIRFLAIVLAALPAFGADREWTQFRGPDSNPVAEGQTLPERWSKTENVEWSTAIPGRGWSSPIVSGGRVFLTTAVTEGESKKPQAGTEYSNEYAAELVKQGLSQKEVLDRVMARDMEMPHEVMLHYFLYCLDIKTGGVLWKKEFHAGRPPGGRHRKNSFTSETPVTDGKAVYVYIANLGLWAFDLKGKQLWHTTLDMHPIYLDFGTGGSPVLTGSQLIVLSDNQNRQFVASFDKRTGKQLWRTSRELGPQGEGQMRSGWTTPYVWTHSLRTELVTVGPRTAISYDLEGKELWRLTGISDGPVPSPFAYDGLLYVNGGRGKPLYAIRAGADGDISLPKGDRANEFVVWSETRGGTYLPTPVAYRGALYALTETGILSRLDARTGKITYRSRLDTDAGTFTSSPWAYGGNVFCLNEEGKTFVVAAGETFKVRGVNPLDEMAQATPAISGDRLLLRTESRLYSIRRRTPL